MIKFEDVKFSFPGSVSPAVRIPELLLEPGDFCVIRGNNGSGKSTVGMLLAGAIPEFVRGTLSGKALVNGKAIGARGAAGHSALVFQDPRVFFISDSVADELVLGKGLRTGSSELESGECKELLFGIPPESPISELSVGQQARLALSLALSSGREVLIFDEPFEYLDVSATKVFLMGVSKLLSRGCIVVVLSASDPPESELLRKATYFHMTEGRLVKGASESYAPERAEVVPRSVGQILLATESIAFAYTRRVGNVLTGISFAACEGELVLLRGRNGSGKTTLLRLLAGLIKPTSGTIFLERNPRKPAALLRSVRLCFQNPDMQVFGTTIGEELVTSLTWCGFKSIELENRLRKAIGLLPFSSNIDPFSLSGGQRKLLALVGTFCSASRVVLLDEPMASLDQTAALVVTGLISDFLRGGGVVLASVHNSSGLAEFSEKEVWLS